MPRGEGDTPWIEARVWSAARMRWLVISGVVTAVVVAVVTLLTSSGDDPTAVAATNYRSRISAIEPAGAGAGVRLRLVGVAGRLQLTNPTGRTVTVLGYQNEPYLRVGPRGVEENVRSPSLYVDGGVPPEDASADAPPEWRRVQDGTTVRWHDHRAHWMGSTDPPPVAVRPDRPHRVGTWQVPLLVGGTPATVTGRLTWVPPPSPWPWYLGAAALAALTAGSGLPRARAVSRGSRSPEPPRGARHRWGRPTLPVATAGLVAATAMLAGGRWVAIPGGVTARLEAVALPLLALVPAGIALLIGGGDRRGQRNRLLLLGATVTSLGSLAGVRHLAWLSHSQLPTALDPSLARLAVTAALGLGTGALLVAAWRIGALWPASTAGPASGGPGSPATGPDAAVPTGAAAGPG